MANTDEYVAAGLSADLYELDREAVRLAMLCRIKLLEPGVIERVIRNDASVCGTSNPRAFAMLHGMMKMHYAVRDKMVDALGQAVTVQVVDKIVERLRKNFGDVLGRPPV
jgi:hypothetical protein